MNERPTPETERVKGALHTNWDDLLNHARRLERERDEARDLADRYRVAFCSAKGDLVPQVFPWEDSK